MIPGKRHSLSVRLLTIVLLSALLVGMILSTAQVVFAYYSLRQSVSTDANAILKMFRDPSTQAAYSLDKETGMQVIEGLLKHQSVSYAGIGNPGELMLAEKYELHPEPAMDWLILPLFGRQKTFSTTLVGEDPTNERYGDLTITLDTSAYGEQFFEQALIIFTSGILRSLALALMLYLIYTLMLTRPLARIIEHLSRINPDHPGAHKVPMIKGHENDELGLWINTANQLLDSIERNSRLRSEAEQSLQRIARSDFLTGLPNRKHLQDQLDRILVEARLRHQRVAVLCVGLDDFKSINEQFGYQTGDQLLIILADRLRDHSGLPTALARLGGDQFALVQAGIEQPFEAAELAQIILDELEKPFTLDDQKIRLRATIGITLYPEDGDNTEKLLQQAEQTMTLAKTRSRNRYQFFIACLDSEMRLRRELLKELRDALPRNELFLVYQPQIDYRSKQVVGVEALLRWRHPEHGLVPPEIFIPLAEHSGSIIEIGSWVVEQACRQLRECLERGIKDLRMAINLSTVQLHHVELPRLVSNLMQRYRLPMHSLEFEVTETGLMEDFATATQNLLSLRRLGALIAIDDFGTGYSSLSYLKTLPLDKLKIDKSFVQEAHASNEGGTIVGTIIQLAKNLNMQVLAEGVETAEQEAYLIGKGCDEGQGYLYSKPLSPKDLLPYLLQSRGQTGSFRLPETRKSLPRPKPGDLIKADY